MSESADWSDVLDFAVGLGGWNVDPSDPFRQPYSPENAALAAAERFGVTDPERIDLIESQVRHSRAIN